MEERVKYTTSRDEQPVEAEYTLEDVRRIVDECLDDKDVEWLVPHLFSRLGIYHDVFWRFNSAMIDKKVMAKENL